MYVWRMENKDGEGPYRTELDVKGLSSAITKQHPSPYSDIKGWIDIRSDFRSEYYFGFASIESALSWFNDRQIVLLYRAGYELVRYSVDKKVVLYGKRQIAFKKSKAKRLNSYTTKKLLTKKV